MEKRRSSGKEKTENIVATSNREILMEIKGIFPFDEPRLMKQRFRFKDSENCCDFHIDHGHYTKDSRD